MALPALPELAPDPQLTLGGDFAPPAAEGADAITTLALSRLAQAPAHVRLLTAVERSLAEYARDLGVSRARLQAVFAQAEAYGKLSWQWAERFAASLGTTPETVYAFFGAEVPKSGRLARGRPARPSRATSGEPMDASAAA